MTNSVNNTVRRGRVGKWILLFFLLLLVFTGLALVFNIAGLRDRGLSIVKRGPGRDTGTGMSLEESDARREKEHFEAENIRISALQKDLEDYRIELHEKEKELEERENLLIEREQELRKLEETFSERYEDLDDLIKIYEKMDSEEAGAILSEIPDSEQVLTIIKNMNKEKSAEILGIMNPKTAAEILSRIY